MSQRMRRPSSGRSRRDSSGFFSSRLGWPSASRASAIHTRSPQNVSPQGLICTRPSLSSVSHSPVGSASALPACSRPKVSIDRLGRRRSLLMCCYSSLWRSLLRILRQPWRRVGMGCLSLGGPAGRLDYPFRVFEFTQRSDLAEGRGAADDGGDIRVVLALHGITLLLAVPAGDGNQGARVADLAVQ